MAPASKRTGGKQAKAAGHRARRTAAIVAGAIITLPAVLSASADVASGWVTAAQRGPLGDPRPAHGYAASPGELGATGQTPHDTTLSPAILHDAGNPTALLTGAGPKATLPNGPLGIPGVVLDAYEHAQSVLSVEQPGCKLPWWLLAGIGKIESGQAENGEVDKNGNTLRPILGPELNGTNGTAAIPSSDGGRWTGDPVWERAVGPMQFLPSTWRAYGGGGNPNNVYDSAIAAGRYLCNGGRDLSDPAQRAQAVFSYNHSDSYVTIVLIWANAYAQGVTPLPETPVPFGPFPSGSPPPVIVGPPVGGLPAVPGVPGAPATQVGAPGAVPGGTGGGGSVSTTTTTVSVPTQTSTTSTPPPPPPPSTCTSTTPPSSTSTTPPSSTSTTPPSSWSSSTAPPSSSTSTPPPSSSTPPTC